IALPHLPLTRNGKIDRNALPAPDLTARGEPPRDALERQVAQVWADVIGRSPGRDDNFFAFGGHSMQATMIAARLRETLGVPVSAAIVFEAQTVAAMADSLRDEVAADPSAVGGEDGPVVSDAEEPREPDPVLPAGVASSPGRVLSFAQQ
ncbi:phosphopantetheine-binding protein, partial [Micromonospora sp. LOL_025]|uniref:phosphopantetheine-binding protein n=1 Tax=Micromonospora sp. LOL_025 TaxID=3345413 RepID=UPI003A898081